MKIFVVILQQKEELYCKIDLVESPAASKSLPSSPRVHTLTPLDQGLCLHLNWRNIAIIVILTVNININITVQIYYGLVLTITSQWTRHYGHQGYHHYFNKIINHYNSQYFRLLQCLLKFATSHIFILLLSAINISSLKLAISATPFYHTSYLPILGRRHIIND